MFDETGKRRKLIIFSEHRDTLNYLTARIRTLLGRPEAVVEIHGGMQRELRREAQESFRQDPDVFVLVATDAAGEGVNLQRAHLLVNYDLPWNPNRIEQRFGRIHRIGQTEVCHMWNMVAFETREGQVFQRLLEKLAEQSKELGGRVFDVLGDEIFEDPLRDLLIEAVRYGDQPEVRAKLDEIVDAAVGEKLRAALKERALLTEMMSATDVEEIRQQMEEAEARKLQPHYIRSFFLEAFKLLGGQISKREPGRYEITNVPAELRNRGKTLGAGIPIVPRYTRVTFEKALMSPPGEAQAQLLAPGHPLLDATVDMVLERYRPLLKQGAMLVAEADESEDPRALVYVEHAIQNARELDDGQRQVVSKRLQFVELTQDWEPRIAGYAPYLDYRPIEPDELELVQELVEEEWLARGVEKAGIDYAITHAVPEHLAEVKDADRDARRPDEGGRPPPPYAGDPALGPPRQRAEAAGARRQAAPHELRPRPPARRRPAGTAQAADDRARPGTPALAAAARRRGRSARHPARADLSGFVASALANPRSTRGRPNASSGSPSTPCSLPKRALGRDPRRSRATTPATTSSRARATAARCSSSRSRAAWSGAPTFTITKNEVLHALNKGDDYVLALVRVDGDHADEIRYIRHPFTGSDEVLFGVTSLNVDWDDMFDRGTMPA